MKYFKAIFIALIICVPLNLSAQISVKNILKNVKKSTENKIENRVERKMNNGVDTLLDGTENKIKGVVKGKEANPQKGNSTGSVNNPNTGKDAKDSPQHQIEWKRFDFVPGTEVIFEDNQSGEQNGEFPSKWDLFQGIFENITFDGSNVIYCIQSNMNSGGGIVPLIKNAKSDYLPDEFTVEFDIYFDEKSNNFILYFLDYKNQQGLDKSVANQNKYITISKNSARYPGLSEGYYPGYNSATIDKNGKWRHISISFNKRALKVYLDDARVMNVPNIQYNPTGISVGFHKTGSTETKTFIKNFRIAKGAVPLYEKMLTDGKFVTTGIRFDVNKAIIKPESMGVINYVFSMMNDNPGLNFSVEGHTDSDGDDSLNLKLSEDRAKAVADLLISMGISQNRLKTAGWGESKPTSDNSTPEGKANNRRVEFIKF